MLIFVLKRNNQYSLCKWDFHLFEYSTRAKDLVVGTHLSKLWEFYGNTLRELEDQNP
ncbi:hypothetical protein pb186bvf_020664 [Paramecium bursaria]